MLLEIQGVGNLCFEEDGVRWDPVFQHSKRDVDQRGYVCTQRVDPETERLKEKTIFTLLC